MNELHYDFIVEQAEALQRLDVFLSRKLAGKISREKIKRAILTERVQVAGQGCASPKRQLLCGERVRLELVDEPAALAPDFRELRILYQDGDIAVLNKPAGLSAHPSPGEPEGTLANRLLAHFPQLAQMEGERPGIVHRLDKDTTGLMVIALNEPARLKLVEDFAERNLHKEYLALVYGVPRPAEGSIELPIGRHPTNKVKMAVLAKGGREAKSDYRTLYADAAGRFSLLAVTIHSGRTHQIRVHLTHLGHPIIGDAVYTDARAVRKAFGVKELSAGQTEILSSLPAHQLLHAWRLELEHPARLNGQAVEALQNGQPRARVASALLHGGQQSVTRHAAQTYDGQSARNTAADPRLRFCCAPPEEFFSAARALSASVQRVALTGNPGCGKSSVLRLLAREGVPTWSADEAVARLYQPDADGWRMLKARFGSRFIPESGNGAAVDKKALFSAMYNDDQLRREVEAIIHPMVYADMEGFFEALERAAPNTPLAVAEVPLYFEALAARKPQKNTGKNAALPAVAPLVAGVHCPLAERGERLCNIRGWSRDMVEKMESWQWPEAKKMAAADFIVENTGDMAALERETRKLLGQISALRLQRLDAVEETLRRLAACPGEHG